MEIKRCTKDSVFTHLFSEPEYLLQLDQSLHPGDTTTTESDLKTVTLEATVVARRMYNDLGFIVGDRAIILVEEQSTWSVNIVFRAQSSLIQTYWAHFIPNRQRIYQPAPIRLPKPELYVVYTGSQGAHPDMLSLKSLFFDPAEGDPESRACDVDARIHVLYDQTSKGILSEYIAFCHELDRRIQIHGRTRKAFESALRIPHRKPPCKKSSCIFLNFITARMTCLLRNSRWTRL